MSTEDLSTSDSEAAFAGAGERWAPVGAVANPEDEQWKRDTQAGSLSCSDADMVSRLQNLEDEQEQLNSSLLALTSHFAQVQFRLKQIVHAQSDEKERMLLELEEFAFKGCPHVIGCRAQDAQMLENSVSSVLFCRSEFYPAEINIVNQTKISQNPRPGLSVLSDSLLKGVGSFQLARL